MSEPPIPPPLPGQLPPPLPPGPARASVPFRDAGGLGTLTVVLLIVDVALAIALLGSTLSEIRLLQKAERSSSVTLDEAQANDARQRGVAAAGGLAFVATGIAWLVWAHRAHTNLDALGARELRFTHGWAVGGFVVPVLNLVRSPQIMSELVRASDPAAGEVDWKERPAPAFIAAWWATYLIGFVMRQIAASLGQDHRISGLIGIDRVLAASQVVIAIAGILAILLVRRVMDFQRARATQLGFTSS